MIFSRGLGDTGSLATILIYSCMSYPGSSKVLLLLLVIIVVVVVVSLEPV